MKLFRRNQAYLLSHPLAFTIGVFATVTGLWFAIVPDFALSASSLGMWLPDSYEIIWPLFHFMGGAAIVYGILYGKPNFEAAGLTLIFFTLSCSCLGVLFIRGFESGLVASSTLGAVAIGCGLRATLLIELGRIRGH